MPRQILSPSDYQNLPIIGVISFLIVVPGEKSFSYLFVRNKDPVNSIEQESRSHDNTDWLVNHEHTVSKEQHENANPNVKHYHEYSEHGMKLLQYLIAVHYLTGLETNKTKITLISKLSA
jgi:hypothetical protein